MTLRMIIVIALLAYIASIQPEEAAECFTDACVGCVEDCTAPAENPRVPHDLGVHTSASPCNAGRSSGRAR